MKLTVAPAAVADLARLREFLVGKDPAAADRAIAALIAAIESLNIPRTRKALRDAEHA